jgi:hypothetical protein
MVEVVAPQTLFREIPAKRIQSEIESIIALKE